MGVDTRLHINQQWRVEDIKDVLEKRFNVPVKVDFHDFAPDYVGLQFKLPGGDYERYLHVHTRTFIGGFPSITLGLRSNPEGIQILKTLAETFGGLLQEQDTGNDFEEYQKPGQNDIDFVVKQAIKDNPGLGSDDQGMASYIAEKKWSSEKVWPKPIKLRGD